MIDPKKDLGKATKDELEAELALYRSVEGVEVPAEDSEELSNNEKRAAVVAILRDAHGHPIRLDAEFLEQNPTLAKVLIEQGAEEGSVVFAEVADLDKAAELDAEAEKRDGIVADLAEKGVTLSEDEVAAMTTEGLEARLKEATEAAKPPADEANKGEGAEEGAEGAGDEEQGEWPEGTQLFYLGKPVISTRVKLLNGRAYREVELAGETHTLTMDEFRANVRPASV